MTATERLLAAARTYAERALPEEPAGQPLLGVAVVACMDCRLDVFSLLGLEAGDAHVIRNAGGVVTADTVRSLALSQRKLGTREVMVIGHTDCGLEKVTDDAFRAEIEAETGLRPDWAVEAFTDVDAGVRQSVERVRRSPFLPHRDHVRGFVYDVHDRSLREVARA